MVQIFISIFPFSVNIQHYFRKCCFCGHFAEFLENVHFHYYQECHFNDHFMRIHHFLTTLSQLIVLIHLQVLIIELIQSKSALNSADSELILSETALFSVDQR